MKKFYINDMNDSSINNKIFNRFVPLQLLHPNYLINIFLYKYSFLFKFVYK